MIFARALLALLLGTGLVTNAAATNAATKPEVRSASALIVDATSGEVLFERQPKLITPIASITKLMTALVVLDALQPLDEVITIKADDRWKGKGAFSHIPDGTKLKRSDLMRLALMASENLAARVLARNYPGGVPAFVHTMNVKAKALRGSRRRTNFVGRINGADFGGLCEADGARFRWAACLKRSRDHVVRVLRIDRD